MRSIVFCAVTLLFSYCSVAQQFNWATATEVGIGSNYALAVDAAGNVYTVGAFEGSFDFDPGVGMYWLTATGMRNIFIQKLSASGDLIWAKSIEGTDWGNAPSIVLDSFANMYITGDFAGTADFDLGPGTSFVSSDMSSSDVFVVKYDSSGVLDWLVTCGSAATEGGTAINLDHAGNIVVTGFFNGVTDFDPGPANFDLTPVPGFADIFVWKLDADGGLKWVKQAGAAGDDAGYSICVDAADNVYTLGGFYDTVDFNPGPGLYDLGSVGSQDIFIQKLDSNGNFKWAHSWGSATWEAGWSVKADGNGNIYCGGDFTGTVDFDPSTAISSQTSQTTYNSFLSKFDTAGTFLWVKTMGSPGTASVRSIDIDGNNNIFSSGFFAGTVDFDPGTAVSNLSSGGIGDNPFIQRLDAAGDFIWAGAAVGTTGWGSTITIDDFGKIYTTGLFTGTMDFDPGPGTATLSTLLGQHSFYVCKLSLPPLAAVQPDNMAYQTMGALYPNPVNNILFLRYSEGEKLLDVLDVSGRSVLSLVELQSRSDGTTISTKQLPAGIFQVRTSQGGYRFVKQ
jgi:hypothetical protein